jgi:thioredoxin-dependent peroxiredoxin
MASKKKGRVVPEAKPAKKAAAKVAKQAGKVGKAVKAAVAKVAAKAKAAVKPAKAKAKGKGGAVGEGDRVPGFELQDQTGKKLASSSLAGEPYVIYFYPKDDTPGCTVEACGFRDSQTNFTARGVRVIGVSPDSVQSHARFRDKHGLNFTLLSDPDRALAKAFGVWVKKQNYGREYMGIERSTFVVDPKGVVFKAWRGVKVPGHVDKVLDVVKTLR